MASLLQLAQSAAESTAPWIPREIPTLPSLPDDPPPSGNHPSWRISFDAADRGAEACSLPAIWRDLTIGRLRAWRESVGPERVLFLAWLDAARPPIGPDDLGIVVRILSGDPQKAIAADVSTATSTISGRYARALSKLDISSRDVPLVPVLAAQGFSGIGPVPAARSCVVDHEGCACLVVSVPRPSTGRLPGLTRAEEEVAQGIVEGYSRFEIARRRATSVNTVARQVHSIFNALQITGRFALIRRAIEFNCFR
jgi:DNA-binding CsgD family transcriptional regulator